MSQTQSQTMPQTQSQPLFLAIDQGGQSSRVALYTHRGECLHCFSAACATTHKVVDGVAHIEQNPQDILLGIQTCLEKITAALGADVSKIVAAGFAGQGSSLLCWDNQTGEALSPVLSWQDVRGDIYLKNIPLTHSQAQQLSGLRVSPHYGASKMRWCLDHNAQVLNAQHNNSLTIGPIVSYIFWHLLGCNSIDPGHAQRTLLWNLHTHDWDDSLLELFKIPRALLPHCHYHNSYFGDLVLNENTSSETRIPFTASARDQGASLFARGLPDANACYINIGTGAFVQRLSEHLHAPEGLLVSPLWIPEDSSAPHYYCWEATVNGAAAALSFLQDHTGTPITPAAINRALALNPDHECYFLNAVGGLSAPYWRTDVQSQFSENLSADEKILAWLESIIFQIAVNVRLMDALGKAQTIYISGGLSNADGLCQKLADLLEVSVHRAENTDATLQGIACLAAGIPAGWNTQTQTQPQKQTDIFQPAPKPPRSHAFAVWQAAIANWLAQ